MSKAALKSLAKGMLQDYQLYWIVRAAIPQTGHPVALPENMQISRPDQAALQVLEQSQDSKVRKAALLSRNGYQAMMLSLEGRPGCVAHFATADNYASQNIWPIGADEICLIDITTLPELRGRGLASLLCAHAAHHYLQGGRSRIFAYIWWNHKASLRCFAKAGWKRCGFSIGIGVRGRMRSLRLPFG